MQTNSPPAADLYDWFDSAADALKEDMRREDSLVECSEFFKFVTNVFPSASEEVSQCIDVSFVENLFWQVPPAKAAAYWDKLPPLQALYEGFHNKPPI
ncbi:hypothetical protein SAMN05518865_10955 [Duganella sp. CF458]|uniref:DUF7674 family protein n=1 Tax=Duganella sp. CF458 TaxID=1884368 RepID=UPI0008E0DDA3|nr:hypothetical protein [Duganella sp. CF458]SFG17366.1 hypothetical protein SAMN05518865_10955 [Duganella sp. CF458]